MTSPPPPPYTEFQEGGAPTPPTLPPRSNNANPSPYNPDPDPSLVAMSSRDPRSSSQQSLVPESTDREGRRRLLLVYIHGFQGNETSFRSFPAHVHNLVTITLGDSHVVHTKIYPRYQSRNAIEQARDNFSAWLTPHEDRWTDVILLSHSMGGLIAADVALLFRHRIIGTIEFDVPFLGMHPGIVKAGLGSIFKPAPLPEDKVIEGSEPTGKRTSRMDTLFNPKPSDPNFNPTFYNDVHLPVRKGWQNTLHWLNKHSSGVIDAGKSLVQQHLEFGGAMADYRGLKNRYARIRALEEDDEDKRRSANPQLEHPPRIRFVNYWTAATGWPKKPKSPREQSPSREGQSEAQDGDAAGAESSNAALDTRPSLETVSPRISVDRYEGDEVVPVTPQDPPSATSPEGDATQTTPTADAIPRPELPEIPPIPKEPPFVDLAEFTDRTARKAAEKEHDQALKEYQKAVKARNKIINERDKIEEKWEKQVQKQQKEQQKEKQKQETSITPTTSNTNNDNNNIDMTTPQPQPEPKPAEPDNTPTPALEEDLSHMQLGSGTLSQQHNSPYNNYDFSNSVIMSQTDPSNAQPRSHHTSSTYSLTPTSTNDTTSTTDPSKPSKPPKPVKIRKFCVLPPEDVHGNKDPTWIRVDMGAIDEVAAHTSLFFVSDRYERLVGDVGARVEDWVREAEGMRAAREMEGLF